MKRSGEERERTCSMRESTDTLSALTLHPGRLSNASTPDVMMQRYKRTRTRIKDDIKERYR